MKRLVSDLSKSGNISVFGLLDWDGENEPTDRIAVLAHGMRDGLENVLLDPLLLALLIVRRFPQARGVTGVPIDVSYIDLLTKRRDLFPSMSSKVAAAVLASEPQTTKPVYFVGGLRVDIDERYLTTDDHDLEAMVLSTFPFLRAEAKRAGNLLIYIISTVLTDSPELIPLEIEQVISDLLSRPAHV